MLPQLVVSLLFLAGIANGLIQSFGMLPSLGLTEISLQYYKELFARGDFISSLKKEYDKKEGFMENLIFLSIALSKIF